MKGKGKQLCGVMPCCGSIWLSSSPKLLQCHTEVQVTDYSFHSEDITSVCKGLFGTPCAGLMAWSKFQGAFHNIPEDYKTLTSSIVRLVVITPLQWILKSFG